MYSEPFTPFLHLGYYVRIDTQYQSKYYRVPLDSTIDFISNKVINLASTSQQVPALDRSNPSSLTVTDIDAFDLDGNRLGQFRIGVLDNVRIEVSQPAALKRFTMRDGAVPLDNGYTREAYRLCNYTMLPEIYIFEDRVSPTITVTNYEFTRSSYARIFLTGFIYKLEEVSKVPPNIPLKYISIGEPKGLRT